MRKLITTLLLLAIYLTYNYYLPAFYFNQGMEMYEEGQLVAAKETFVDAAEMGSAEALYMLGVMELNKKTQEGNQAAFNLLGEAIKKGSKKGYGHLADFYAYGFVAKKDELKARQLYEGAVKNKDPIGINYYGVWLLSFDEEASDRKAAEMFRASAELGYKSAQLNLGMSLLEGRYYLECDQKKGAEMILRAEKQGFKPAVYFCGLIYHYGAGVEQNFNKALYYYRRSLKSKFLPTIFELNKINAERPELMRNYEIDISKLTVQAYSESMKIFMQRRKINHFDSLLYAALFLKEGIGGDKSMPAAAKLHESIKETLVKYTQNSCPLGDYYTGLLMLMDEDSENKKAAVEKIKKAAKAKYFRAERWLANYSESI